jgi:hypothetical protein
MKTIRAAALVAGCVLLVTLFVRLGPARIVSLLVALGWNFPIIVTIFATHELVRTLALRRWLPVDNRPPQMELLRLRLMGEAAGALTRTGALTAEPARAWLLANRGGQGVAGYWAAAGELLSNSAASSSVNVVVAGTLLWTDSLHGRAIVVLAHVCLWSSLAYLVGLASVTMPWVFPEKTGELKRAIRALWQRPGELTSMVLFELLAQALLITEAYWALRSMGIPISLRSALVMEVMTRPLTIVELMGATEMGFALVATWLGIPAAIGFTLSLTKTLRSLSAAGVMIGLTRAAEWIIPERPERGERPERVDAPPVAEAALDSAG